jgi:hypothetical protein
MSINDNQDINLDYEICTDCRKSFPLNELWLYDELAICNKCEEKRYKEK